MRHQIPEGNRNIDRGHSGSRVQGDPTCTSTEEEVRSPRVWFEQWQSGLPPMPQRGGGWWWWSCFQQSDPLNLGNWAGMIHLNQSFDDLPILVIPAFSGMGAGQRFPSRRHPIKKENIWKKECFSVFTLFQQWWKKFSLKFAAQREAATVTPPPHRTSDWKTKHPIGSTHTHTHSR